MRHFKRLFTHLLLTSLLFSPLTACKNKSGDGGGTEPGGGGTTDIVAVQSISVNPQSLNLKVGGSNGKITATITPNNATNKDVTWSIAPSGIATVYASGLTATVTPAGEGSATITVKTADGNKTAICNLNVAESANPDPGDPTDPVDPADPSDPTDPVDPADPTDPTDPIDPGEGGGTDPTDPVDPADPSEGEDCDNPTNNAAADMNIAEATDYGPGDAEGSTMPEAIPYQTVTQDIGVSGGAIADENNNVVINIPENALSETSSISATYVDEPSLIDDKPAINFMGAVDFGPSGTEFDEDVSVTIKLAKTTKKNSLSVFCYDEENEVWDYVTNASVSGNNATFNVRHFSRYKCVDITPEMLDKFNDLVRSALDNGYSDSWVMEQYKDYLINEEHLMDEYAQYDGLWYEACGLTIDGDYYINGKEGDPNVLIETVGRTNKVGNKFGLCYVAGQMVSRQKFIEAKKNKTENTEIIGVTVSLDYEMIKPNIDLNADKVILEEGEETTVNVYTHYSNPKNQLHPDFPLPNYPLTLPYHLKHFSTDVKEFTTDDDAMGSFKVTAIDSGTEFVKVMFYVSGIFGQYSANYIKFKCGGDYEISGHITETRTGTYHTTSEFLDDDKLELTSDGSFSISFEYDFEGAIDINEDGTYTGLIQFTDFSLTISSCSPTIYIREDDETYEELEFTLFDEDFETLQMKYSSYSFTAEVSEDFTCNLVTSEISDFAVSWIAAYLYLYVEQYGHTGDSDVNYFFMIYYANKSSLLLPFTLIDGDNELNSTTWKDDYREETVSASGSGVSIVDYMVVFVTQTYEVTQQITIVDHTLPEN